MGIFQRLAITIQMESKYEFIMTTPQIGPFRNILI